MSFFSYHGSSIEWQATTDGRGRAVVRPMPAERTNPPGPAPSPGAPGTWSTPRPNVNAFDEYKRGKRGITAAELKAGKARSNLQKLEKFARASPQFAKAYDRYYRMTPEERRRSDQAEIDAKAGINRGDSPGGGGGAGSAAIVAGEAVNGGEGGLASPQSWVLLLAVAGVAWFLLKG